MENKNDLIEIGFVRAAHGLRGQVVVHAHSRDAESLTKYGALLNADGSKEYELKVLSDNGTDFMCSVKGINDRNQAEALRGTKFFIPASALPPAEEGEYYIRDLIGLEVRNEAGTVLGKIVNVPELGAQHAFDIDFVHDGKQALPQKQTEMLLFIKRNVPVVDVKGGFVVIDLPEGLLTEPEEKQEKDA